MRAIFSGPPSAKATVLTGDLDQIEIIGTAIDAASVAKLYEAGQWMAR